MFPQFQESDPKNIIRPQIKYNDCEKLLPFLLPLFRFKLQTKDLSVTITDLGCGEGQMLETLLNLLSQNLKDYLALQITIYGCEPVLELQKQYLGLFQNTERPTHLTNIINVDIEPCCIENYQPKKSDVFLFSHSLYYAQTIWNSKKYPDIRIDEHLLTCYLQNLKAQGLLCVVLQSEQLPKDEDGVHGVIKSNNKQYEEIMYPIIGRSTDNLISAEDFEYCLQTFRDQHTQQLNVQDACSISVIPLGEINFVPDKTKAQCYKQTKTVEQFLNFYTREFYPKLTGDKQKMLLDFIKENCITSKNSLVMCHVNRLFVITPSQPTLSADCQTVSVPNTISLYK